MGFDVSGLANYTREYEGKLVTSLVYAPKTAQVISEIGNVQVGIKSTEKITVMDTDVVFQAGGSCGFNASGSTSFTQRTITVGKIKVHEALCPKDLEAKFTQKALSAGSSYDSIAYAEEYTAKKIGKIGEKLETAIWQGDTASADENLKRFDGFIKLIGAVSGSTVNANSTTFLGTAAVTGHTSANIVNSVNAIYKAIPTSLLNRSDVVLFMGWDLFRLYGTTLTEGKYFVNWSEGLKTGEMMIPNTNVKIIAVNGLNGTNKMYATYGENLFVGTDLLNEEEQFKMFFAVEADQIRFMSEFKYGVQFAFPEAIVRFEV